MQSVEKGREPLMKVENLSKYFKISKKETLKAVDNVSFEIYKGETVSLVGESGCGKSTTGRCLLNLYKPTGGCVTYQGKEIGDYHKKNKTEFCHKIQMIFQNPYSSLNSRMTIKEIVGEGLSNQKKISDKEINEKVEILLKTVGLNKDHMSRFPHEFSGGQRQRIGIARALSVEPEFIVCDEPISALDVSIQAQVINMLKELQEKLGLTYLFIAHDLSVVKYISDKVIVMYLGTIVESADAERLYANPMHPYTKVLLSSIPVADPQKSRKTQRIMAQGEISSPINPKPGCRFAGRCPYTKEICRKVSPALKEIEPGHQVSCHLF